jgi:ribosomal protein L25 (general stress protein Ctc)
MSTKPTSYTDFSEIIIVQKNKLSLDRICLKKKEFDKEFREKTTITLISLRLGFRRNFLSVLHNSVIG